MMSDECEIMKSKDDGPVQHYSFAIHNSKRRAYPRYKPSGIEWLGEIPEHWSAAPVKRKYQIQLGKMLQNKPETEEDILIPYIKALHVSWGIVKTLDLPEMWAKPADINTYGVAEGDLLVCEGGEAGRAGVVDYLPGPCIIQNALHRVRSQGADVMFLQYVLQTIGHSGWLDVLCNKATIAHFTREKLSDLPIPLPPLREQRAIAAFLDREMARIDGLIEKKQRQIELLQEKRSALINHAVTKGLDPNAKMKDSGIEWLGEIPEHWRIIPLKYSLVARVGALKTGPFGSQLLSSEMMNGPIKVYNQRNVLDQDFTSGENFISEGKYKELVSFTVFSQDILITTRGTIGRCAVLPEGAERGILHPCLMRIQADRAIVTMEFLATLIQDSGIVLLQLQLMSNATTIDVIYSDSLKSVRLPLPPISEQRAITAFLDRETTKIDTLIEKVETSIDLLQEYRTALIAVAVTGKIDVRDVVFQKMRNMQHKTL